MSLVNNTKYKNQASSQEQITAHAGFNLVTAMRTDGALTHQKDVASLLISNESFSEAQLSQVQTLTAGIEASIESFFRANANIGNRAVTPMQKEAVAFALASAQNPIGNLRRQGNKQLHKSSGPLDIFIADNSGMDPAKLGEKSLEAYDTKPNDEMLQFTAAFALATAQQNHFTEMFYKTVNLSPDQYAIEMEIPLISVHDQVRHELERRITDFNRLNIVNAEIDHTILKNDTLKIVPIVRAQTADAFVDPALVAPRDYVLEDGETVKTAPLRTNYRSSLFRLAQSDAQLQKGILDQTDALDVGAVLTAVYVQFQNADASVKEVVRIDTLNAPKNQFTNAHQGATRLMELQFVTDAATINANTKLFNGAASTLLSAFDETGGHKAWMTFSVRGDIDLRDSSYEMITGSVFANTIKDNTDKALDLTAGSNAALVKLFADAKVIGVDIDSRKVNSNLRELGQLADFNTYRQVYGVSLGSPLAVQRPITNGDQQDALHAAALSYMCKVRQSNVGITQLFSEIDTLRAYSKRSDVIGRQPEIMGISSYLVEPVLEELNLDLPALVTTTSQHERRADIQAILTDACTIVGYKLWQKSNWQAAANLLEGTEAQAPIVKLGTDMVLTQYLMIEGDTRTVGPDFSYEKAWSMDARVRDKIFVALGYPTNTPGVPHPLDHGMMINKPEVVAALNLSRGSHSRELIVHPSFRHIPLCPILGVITVTGLQEALTGKAVLGVEVTNAADFPVADPAPVAP